MGPAKTANTLAHGAVHVSKRLIASYVVDWILLIVIAAVGGAFSRIHGNKHAFSLDDPNISFPNNPDTVSTGVLLLVSVVAPAIITTIVSFVFVPGPTVQPTTPKALRWRRKLWEWNTAWMGLGLALAGAFMVTEGLKDLAGKPRPHALATCNPDLSAASIAKYRVGGLGQSITSAVPILVDWHICQNTNSKEIRDAFASWPSGHSSFSWAGMVYLTLYLSAKFAVGIPFLTPASSSQGTMSTFEEHVAPPKDAAARSADSAPMVPARNQAAAPPIYLLIVAFIPIGTAAFIAVSRWVDYHHHGFDVLSGSLLGAFFGWFGFRWYHLPIRQGAGWSWGARTRDRAFFLGIGIPSYVGDEGWESAQKRPNSDLESGTEPIVGSGLPDQPESEIANHPNPSATSINNTRDDDTMA